MAIALDRNSFTKQFARTRGVWLYDGMAELMFTLAWQSLMNFVLPQQFTESLSSLRAIFKVKGDSKVTLLAQERVSRAKKMMTPFVLRRRKDQATIYTIFARSVLISL